MSDSPQLHPWPDGHREPLQRRPDRAVTTPGPGFSFTVSRALGTVVLTPHGVLDEESSSVLDGALRDLIDDQGNLSVVVDVRYLTVADPAFLAVFDGAASAAARRGGTLTVAEPLPPRQRGIADHPAGNSQGQRRPTPIP